MRSRGLIAGIVLLIFVAMPGLSCGPFLLEMTFVNPRRPDNLKEFVEGRAFAVQTTFYVRSLALSYRIFNGPALTSAEKKDLLATYAADDIPEPPHPGLHAWDQAYTALLGRSGPQSPPVTAATVPGSQWESYTNCHDDAFATAARTLASRRKQHPEATLAVIDWARAQDAVFSNCGAVHNLPAALPAGAPLWLKQDRAYQLAAAHLYRNEWADAQSGFTAIAADNASPWHELASYLVGRTLVRQATLADEAPGQTLDGGVHFDIAAMTQAETQMKLVAASKSPYADAASEMLNFIEFRLHPGRAEARVGNFVSKPDKHLAQHLIDLRQGYDNAWENDRSEAVRSDLVDWVITMQNGLSPAVRPQGHALNRWRETHSTAWLVAALLVRLPNDSVVEPDLLAAADAVPETSPAWPTVIFARLAHTPPSAETFQRLLHARDALLAEHALPSAVNQAIALAIRQAPSIDEFARLAPMDPAGIRLEEVDFTPLRPADNHDLMSDGIPPSLAKMAGQPANVLGVKRFDDATAVLLNDHLPTAVLAPLVVHSNWPKQLRFEAAMAVWARAVLLDQPEQARQLTPILVDGEPAWAPLLNAYDAASTPESRHLAGLLALMRYPSVRPFVNAGPTRDDGFTGYSSFRDNWWCAKLDAIANNASYLPRPDPPSALPPFITPELAATAQEEEAQLQKLGDAPMYFGTQALAWVKAHPRDTHNGELLRSADRAIRNGCNLELAYKLRQEIRAKLGLQPKQ